MRTFKKRGKYWIDFTIRGRRVRKPISTNKKDAENVLAKIRTDILFNKYSIPREEKIKFLDLAKLYLDRHALQNPRSLQSIISKVKNLVAFFGNFLIQDITSFQIEEYKKARLSKEVKKGKPLSPTTLNRDLEVLNNMMNLAVQWGYLSAPPFAKIKKFRESPRERILMKEEITSLLSITQSPLKEIILIALNTGMRLGEILSLEYDQINLDGGFVYLKKTKSGKPRKIPLNDAMREIFAHLCLNRSSKKYVFENKKSGRHMVFIRKSFMNKLKKAGIQNVRFHDLRHTFATYALMNGCDIYHLSQILGHTSITTTMRYLSVKSEGLQKVVNSFVVKDTQGGEVVELPDIEEKKFGAV